MRVVYYDNMQKTSPRWVEIYKNMLIKYLWTKQLIYSHPWCMFNHKRNKMAIKVSDQWSKFMQNVNNFLLNVIA